MKRVGRKTVKYTFFLNVFCIVCVRGILLNNKCVSPLFPVFHLSLSTVLHALHLTDLSMQHASYSFTLLPPPHPPTDGQSASVKHSVNLPLKNLFKRSGSETNDTSLIYIVRFASNNTAFGTKQSKKKHHKVTHQIDSGGGRQGGR